MDTDDIDTDELAAAVVAELDPGQRIGDKIILSKRQLLAIAGAGLSAGALAQFGISEAEAQEAAGAVGTDDERVDVEGFDVTAENSLTDPGGTTHTSELAGIGDTASSTSTADGFEVTIEGDTYQFNE